MNSGIYLTFESSVYALKTSHKHPALSPEPRPSVHTTKLRRNRPYGCIPTCWELLFAVICSVVCSAYTLRYEDRNAIDFDSLPQVQLPDLGNGYSSVILDPQPIVMFGACLVLGCSIASFMFRRQDRDQYQNLIFAVMTIAAILIGLKIHATANLIMLGLIPWSLCLAMVFSIVIHWLLKRCKKHAVYTNMSSCDSVEKGGLLESKEPQEALAKDDTKQYRRLFAEGMNPDNLTQLPSIGRSSTFVAFQVHLAQWLHLEMQKLNNMPALVS